MGLSQYLITVLLEGNDSELWPSNGASQDGFEHNQHANVESEEQLL